MTTTVSIGAPPRTRSQTARQVLVLAGLAVVALAAHLWYGLRNHFFDLGIYREAMRWWADGHPLYSYARPDATQGQLEFTYPPAAGYLMRPLAWLTWHETITLFSVVAVAALAASIWWLVRPIADRHGWVRWFAFGVAFVLATGLEPIRISFDFGQINFIVWGLVVFDLAVLAPRGSRFLGVGIGLATALKLVPGIFVVYLLVSRRWRAAAVAAGTALLATLLAAALSPAQTWTFFSERLSHGEGVGQLAYVMNQSLLGVLARLAQPGDASTLAWILLALPVLGYGMWRAGRAALAGDELTGLALTGFVGSLVSPLTWAHHIFWFVPALLALIDTAASAKGVRSGLRGRRALLITAAFVYTTVTLSMLQWWAFNLGEPGGPVGFVLSNWLVLLMLALLPLLPIRARATVREPDHLEDPRDHDVSATRRRRS